MYLYAIILHNITLYFTSQASTMLSLVAISLYRTRPQKSFLHRVGVDRHAYILLIAYHIFYKYERTDTGKPYTDYPPHEVRVEANPFLDTEYFKQLKLMRE